MSDQQKEFITITLNARLQPDHRAELEDALNQVLETLQIGEVCGGGTLLADNGEVSECDIEIAAVDTSPETISQITDFLEVALAPKGSRIYFGDGEQVINFGQHEGLALYLNGTELADEVYQECDINVVWEELENLLEDEGSIHSYHEGDTETALYLYGNSYSTMHELIKPFLNSYPLCAKCRVEQIA